MAKSRSKVIKCEGRFHETRELFYNEVFPVILEGRQEITLGDLDSAWFLSLDDLHRLDARDPYYESRVDRLRRAPGKDQLSLIPLIESQLHLEDGLVGAYARSMGVKQQTSEYLELMSKQPGRFLSQDLKREPKSIILPGGKNLAGYSAAGNFGIGTVSQGGPRGGGIRSDSPFLLEIYHHDRDGANLVGVVGFWAQGDSEANETVMLVSQMQSCRNARFPEGVPFGVGCLHVAETAARAMGFDRISAYCAKGHPIFYEHPDSWKQLGEEFVCMWDGSAKKLGFDGSRNCHYTKSLK